MLVVEIHGLCASSVVQGAVALGCWPVGQLAPLYHTSVSLVVENFVLYFGPFSFLWKVLGTFCLD